jgi:hypothetical protein
MFLSFSKRLVRRNERVARGSNSFMKCPCIAGDKFPAYRSRLSTVAAKKSGAQKGGPGGARSYRKNEIAGRVNNHSIGFNERALRPVCLSGRIMSSFSKKHWVIILRSRRD